MDAQDLIARSGIEPDPDRIWVWLREQLTRADLEEMAFSPPLDSERAVTMMKGLLHGPARRIQKLAGLSPAADQIIGSFESADHLVTDSLEHNLPAHYRYPPTTAGAQRQVLALCTLAILRIRDHLLLEDMIALGGLTALRLGGEALEAFRQMLPWAILQQDENPDGPEVEDLLGACLLLTGSGLALVLLRRR